MQQQKHVIGTRQSIDDLLINIHRTYHFTATCTVLGLNVVRRTKSYKLLVSINCNKQTICLSIVINNSYQ